LPAVALEVQESRQSLWRKATLTFTYIYENYLNDHDWFFKADDDTYALIDNMREYLTTLNSSLPFFLGHEFPYDIRPNITFLSGGAGNCRSFNIHTSQLARLLQISAKVTTLELSRSTLFLLP